MSKRVGYSPAMASEQTWGDWYNDHRLAMNPLVTGAVVGLAGVGNALVFPIWPHTVAWVAIATLGLLIWTITLGNAGQRRFYRLLIAVGDAWIFLLQTTWAMEHWRAFAIGWFVAVMMGGIGYASDQRVRTKIAIKREIDSWPPLARKIGIPKSRISPRKETDAGYRQRLSWDPGDYVRSAVFGLKEHIESALQIPAGMLRMMPVTDSDSVTNSNSWDLVVNTNSPARKAPVEFGDATMHSICDQMYVGIYEDGRPVQIHWYEQGFGGVHTLAAGITRSGKSGLYRLMLGDSAPCNDVVRLGIDAKGGMALRPWAPMFDWLVCGRNGAAVEEQQALLEWLDAVMVYREIYAAERKWDVWKVSRKHPLIILYVDEAAEVFGLKMENFSAVQLVEKIGRMGAGTGVLLCAATQYPTVEAIASSQIQSQIGRRFCFRVERTAHQHVILPNAGNIDATFPDKPIGSKGAGWCYLSDQGAMDPMPLRVRNLKPEKVFELVEAYAGHVGRLDAGSAGVPVRAAEYAARCRWTVEDVRPNRDDDDVWEDERDEMADDSVTGGVTENVPEARTQGVTEDRTESVTEAKEQDMNGEAPAGVEVSLEELVRPRTPEEAEELAAALAKWNAEHDEWPTERALEAFWSTLKLLTGTTGVRGPGVRAGQLMEACHRSGTWVHDEMRKAREAGLIEPVKAGSTYYRLVHGAKIPASSNAA